METSKKDHWSFGTLKESLMACIIIYDRRSKWEGKLSIILYFDSCGCACLSIYLWVHMFVYGGQRTTSGTIPNEPLLFETDSHWLGACQVGWTDWPMSWKGQSIFIFLSLKVCTDVARSFFFKFLMWILA